MQVGAAQSWKCSMGWEMRGWCDGGEMASASFGDSSLQSDEVERAEISFAAPMHRYGFYLILGCLPSMRLVPQVAAHCL